MKRTVTNYNDIDYKDGFWGDRLYENLIEQHLVEKMLHKSCDKFLDLGAGFGRLVPGYINKIKDKVTLFDYSDKLLNIAKKKYSKNEKVDYVQGNFYELPFADSYFDGGVSVRVIHHVEDVPQFFKELNRVMKDNAVFVLEYANKRNVLEIIRKAMGRAKLNPFKIEPENRSEKGLTYNFHPKYIKEQLEKHGFMIEKQVASSLLRVPIMKKIIGQRSLAFIEKKFPMFLRKFAITPSVFLQIRKVKK